LEVGAMTATGWLWMVLFWAMQVVAQLLFKWGSLPEGRWWLGFFGGHAFGATSILIIMFLYKTVNANVVYGISFGGMFLLASLALAIVYRTNITTVQYVGVVVITAGILMLALGGTEPSAAEIGDRQEPAATHPTGAE